MSRNLITTRHLFQVQKHGLLGVRSLRDLLINRGWQKADPGNYSMTYNDELRLNIVVASGDRATGNPTQNPKTKSVKGIKTELAIQSNQMQEDMFEYLLPEDNRVQPKIADYQTWVLLIHVTEESTRMELSLPLEIERGFISKWKERIIIPEIFGDPEEIKDEHDLGEEIDVKVTRKAN